MNRSRWLVGGLHVATLVWVGGDFPWVHGRFEPGPGWAAVEGFLPSDGGGARWLDDDALAAAGHPPETWLLVDEDDEEPCFLHALVRRGEDDVSWRFGGSPLELDDPPAGRA
ncbi:hypothetical protein OOK41_19360 [Micromonospora sp. NBC_01655]|uniref:hypothetical protein n=1 Tax=Micromonospora sp. NBC_01655 TaxID=2975983 RepID=UPI0022533FEC|nr:hypothetical protein [Micromonospora sp. NBC_01655]MCX4472439.1 hypothetical protein [Micromonospora sp. NBC_01655]